MRMRMKKCCFVALFVLAVLCLAGPGTAATRYVTQDGAGDEDGSSWANASKNLKDVMEAADAGDEIWVAAGTYSPGSDETDTFLLRAGVKVYGGFAGTEDDLNQRDWAANVATLHGGGVNYHVVTGGDDAASDDTRLDGFTVTGGNANGSDRNSAGGGMYNENSSPTVANCTFSGNRAQDGGGGGMLNKRSSPMVENCVFSGNTAQDEGGGMANENSSPTVANCTFSGNKSGDYGGGMYNGSSNPTVENCVFSGNEAEGCGGGMSNNGSNPTVEKCTFSGNTANSGGGMSNGNSSSPIVASCIFSGNTAESGGGMDNGSSSPTLVNCVFSGNEASWFGGGMDSGHHSCPIVVSCTFSGNTAESGGGMYNGSSNPALVNCTFSENKATTKKGGGMHNYDSSLTVVNTILWANEAPTDKGPDIYQSAGTLTLDHCVVGVYNTEDNPTVVSTDLITGDPQLTALDVKLQPTMVSVDVYIYKLEDGSSALDAGLPIGETIRDGVKVPDVDQLGTTRPQGAGVDIGAFERKR